MKRIAVLDDDEIFPELIAAALEGECEVVTGRNGLQGIALCLEGGIDAVVTDIGMPDFDGMQLLAEMNKKPQLAAIPVLVVTATHFTRLSRTLVSRYPQVKRMLNKDESIDTIAGQILEVLAGGGRAGF